MIEGSDVRFLLLNEVAGSIYERVKSRRMNIMTNGEPDVVRSCLVVIDSEKQFVVVECFGEHPSSYTSNSILISSRITTTNNGYQLDNW